MKPPIRQADEIFKMERMKEDGWAFFFSKGMHNLHYKTLNLFFRVKRFPKIITIYFSKSKMQISSMMNYIRTFTQLKTFRIMLTKSPKETFKLHLMKARQLNGISTGDTYRTSVPKVLNTFLFKTPLGFTSSWDYKSNKENIIKKQ